MKRNPQTIPLPFELPPEVRSLPGVGRGTKVWTQNKAKLVARYLFYFELITRHGTYIDGFAGPQDTKDASAWAAKLVLELKPTWLRHFYLVDADRTQASRLRALKANHPRRDVHVWCGDFNRRVHQLLTPRFVGAKEATFCLLDQRTFECHWATVAALARYKERKIELFYFLANSWIERAFSGLKHEAAIRRWWGREDWEWARTASRGDRLERLCARFRTELGYQSAVAWPIYEREGGSGVTMYYMIHATDHEGAVLQMARAYKDCVVTEPDAQLKLL